MNLSVSTDLARIPTAHRPSLRAQKAAQDFEAVLLGSVLDSLQKTFSGAPDDGPPGSSDYGFMGAQALAQAVATRGGLGIAQLILKSWTAHEGTTRP